MPSRDICAAVRRFGSRPGREGGIGGWGALLALCLLLAGCAGALNWEPQGHHTVRRGETLYSIAWRHDLDHRDLARWNNLSNPNVIYPGQTLRLSPPPGYRSPSRSSGASEARSKVRMSGQRRDRSARSAPPPPVTRDSRESSATNDWQWPIEGRIVRRFSPSQSKGIDIAGKRGQAVRAAADGTVVYGGSGLVGYGQLIIIKHNNELLSAYAYNERLYVKEGDDVVGGQQIARLGVGPDNQPKLHFEIRVDGRPVDPLTYMPPP